MMGQFADSAGFFEMLLTLVFLLLIDGEKILSSLENGKMPHMRPYRFHLEVEDDSYGQIVDTASQRHLRPFDNQRSRRRRCESDKHTEERKERRKGMASKR